MAVSLLLSIILLVTFFFFFANYLLQLRNHLLVSSLKLLFISLCSQSVGQEFELGSLGRFYCLMSHQLSHLVIFSW